MTYNAGIQLIINTLVVVKTFKMSNNMRKLCFLCNTVLESPTTQLRHFSNLAILLKIELLEQNSSLDKK